MTKKNVLAILKIATPLVVALVLIVFMTVQVFAWFVLPDSNNVGEFNVSVASDTPALLDIIAIPKDDEIPIGKELELYPGGVVRLRAQMANANDYDVWRTVTLDQIQVRYPTQGNEDYFLPKYILHDSMYSTAVSNPYVPALAETETEEAFFRRFIAPATNAYKFAVYADRNQYEFHPGYTPAYFTNAPKATNAMLTASFGVLHDVITVPRSLPVSNYGTFTYGGITQPVANIVDAEGRIRVPANTVLVKDEEAEDAEPFYVYIYLQFDETILESIDYATESGSVTVTLNNNNCYMGQTVRLLFSAVDTKID